MLCAISVEPLRVIQIQKHHPTDIRNDSIKIQANRSCSVLLVVGSHLSLKKWRPSFPWLFDMTTSYFLQLLGWLVLIVLPAAGMAWGLWQWSHFLPLKRIVRALSILFTLLTIVCVVLFFYALVLILTGEASQPPAVYSLINGIRQLARIVVDLTGSVLVIYAAIKMRQLDDEKRRKLIEAHNDLIRLKGEIRNV